jgi:DNA-binding transcriptional LysR family regulator
MKWRFEDMMAFLVVIEAGSVTSAATRLNVSKSVVSKRVSDFEDALGTELFNRSTNGFRATDTAQSLYERVRPLIQAITDATEDVSQIGAGLTGRLRVMAPISLGTNFLGPVIADFARRHRELEISVDYDDGPVSLSKGRYDLGIRLGKLTESSLKARKLYDCVRIVCCSPDYAKSCGLPDDLASLAEHSCIDYAHVRTSDFWQFHYGAEKGRPISVLMRSRVVANNFEAMRDMAIAGIGLVLLPDFLAASPLSEGLLIPALPRVTPLPYRISAVYPCTRHVAPKIRSFVDHLLSAFAPPLPWHRSPLAGSYPSPRPSAEPTSVAA